MSAWSRITSVPLDVTTLLGPTGVSVRMDTSWLRMADTAKVLGNMK